MRIFITGASGFIGGAIAQVMATDHEVLAMSRSDKSDRRVRELGARSMLSAVVRPIAKAVEGIWRMFNLSSTPPITRHSRHSRGYSRSAGTAVVRL